ncbi:adhesion G-protein coupled receptor G6-like [Styela clava]
MKFAYTGPAGRFFKKSLDMKGEITSLVQVIDNVLLKLEVLTEQNVYLDSKNVKVAVAGISGNETFTGKSFTLSSNLQPGISDGTDSGGNSGRASVFIPPSVTEKVTSSSFTRIQFTVYTSTALFNVSIGFMFEWMMEPCLGLGSNMNVSVYSDHVVSASIGNTKITGLSENVTITISRSNSYYGKGPHCVFYNFPNNGGEGSWSAEGCHLNPESTSTTTICDCKYLTNFAVIMVSVIAT